MNPSYGEAGLASADCLQQQEAASEEALALRFAQENEANLRYCAAWERWMHWDGVRWAPDKMFLATDYVRDLCRRAADCADPESRAANNLGMARKVEGMGARALAFAIYTATRSGEVRGATWTVPASRTKQAREHRVPLSNAAVELLESIPRVAGSAYVFPSSSGKQLSDMTMSAVCRRLKVAAVPHGFRSTFRDWCGERTTFPREVAEAALGHSVGNEVEAAYRRGDALEKRRRLMEAWAGFLSKPVAKAGNVTPIGEAAA